MFDINGIILKILESFGTIIFKNNYVFLDYWTIAHFGSGLIIMFLILKFFKDLKIYEQFILLFILIGFWEIFELMSSWIKSERYLDIFYDFVVGMSGGYTYFYFKEK